MYKTRVLLRPRVLRPARLTKLWLAAALAMTAAPLTVVAAVATPAAALGNGLALTPPMGWNDWNTFGCNVTEQLVKQTADSMVSSGLAAAGYQYVNIDDCWMQHSRDASGNLVAGLRQVPRRHLAAPPPTCTARA